MNYEFGDDAELVVTGSSNPSLSLESIAEYTQEQRDILEIVRRHPRNTETIAWGIYALHNRYISENKALNILLELQSLGAVDAAFTLGDFTYWVLGRGGLTPLALDAATAGTTENRNEPPRK
jgi:hypothetical protein